MNLPLKPSNITKQKVRIPRRSTVHFAKEFCQEEGDDDEDAQTTEGPSGPSSGPSSGGISSLSSQDPPSGGGNNTGIQILESFSTAANAAKDMLISNSGELFSGLWYGQNAGQETQNTSKSSRVSQNQLGPNTNHTTFKRVSTTEAV